MNQPNDDYPYQEFHIAVTDGMANINFPYNLPEADWRKIRAVLDIVKPEDASDNTETVPIIHSKHTVGSQRAGYRLAQYKLDYGVVDVYMPKEISAQDLFLFIDFLLGLQKQWFPSPARPEPKRRGRPPKITKGSKTQPVIRLKESLKSKETSIPQNGNISCLRPDIPFISAISCAEWQHRWHSPKLEPSIAWDKLKPCRECEHEDREGNGK